MRITDLDITNWRNLRDLHLVVPSDARLISLVGSNGSGKTNLLELLSFAAAQFGLAAGVRVLQRQSPPPESQFTVTLTVSDDIHIDPLVIQQHLGVPPDSWLREWDRTLILRRFPAVPSDPPPGWPSAHAGELVFAGGIEPDYSRIMGSGVVQAINQRLELNHLFLDADRTYGSVTIRDDEILAASREDLDAPGRARQRAISSSPSMYGEWLRDALGLEHRHAAAFAQAHREASERGEDGPPWEDPWTDYREAVEAILPHLTFVRPDQERKTLVFRSGGQDVLYQELSGGEREVAFLAGQLLRFRLRRGILLLDEPELHLNAELLERWLSWAADGVTAGQVWISTHSLEAVEVAGPENALVLERGQDGLVSGINRLADRPIMSTLSGVLGAPAFSLDRQRFILIEGERPGLERGRFASLCPGRENLFLESGSCKQVVNKLALVTALAEETDRLHVGAVIDRDHWDARQRQRYTDQAPVHILGVHEVENFFLLPDALVVLVQRNGGNGEDADELLREASDRFAGLWIAQHAALRHDIDPGPAVRERAGSLTWSALDAGRAQAADELANLADLADEELRPKVREWFVGAIDRYAAVREGDTLWKECSGKQVVGAMAPALGMADGKALERQVLTLIEDGSVSPPRELEDLRAYIAGLSAAGV